MITSTVKKQLLVFVLITLIGVSYVGARYAQLNRLFYDATYTVAAHFSQSGGIYTGAEVSYRGVGIGKVSDMKLTKNGVDVILSIDKGNSKIPKDSIALVANRSAVGEQFVDLQPQKDGGPYLKQGSSIATPDTATPVSTTDILTNLDNLVESVPQADLRTVVAETGAAFHDAGPSLGQIIDTSSSFINAAEANFGTTTALIRDARTVLQTQVDKGSDIRAFTRDLALFSGTVAANDKNLRSLIDNGSATANELRTFLEQNKVNLGQLINNLVTTGEVTVKHLKGIRQILVIYPYIVAGGFTVAKKGATGPDAGKYDAQFGLILTQDTPVCHAGYHKDQVRPPSDTSDKPMDTTAGCTDASANPRGAEKAPNGRAGTDYRSPVATYDQSTHKVTWGTPKPGPEIAYDGGAAQLFGSDSWKWMLLQPSMADDQE
jgi:phospholipid/cholesterol/gamma-HCH transport system substrate-binding protein